MPYLNYSLPHLGIFANGSLQHADRIKEIGIRKVNGAKVFEILALINKDFIKWIAIAFVIATPVAYFACVNGCKTSLIKQNYHGGYLLCRLNCAGHCILTVSWQSWKAATRKPG